VTGDTDLEENPTFCTIALSSRDKARAVLGVQITGHASVRDMKCCGLFQSAASFHRWLRSTGWLTSAEDVYDLTDEAILSWWGRAYGPDYNA